VRMPLPAGGPVFPSCAGGQVLIASGDDLIAVAAASVPSGQPTAALELRSLSATPPAGGPSATVTMAGVSGVIVVDHPDLGRVRFMRHPEAPALAIGDRIYLDEVDLRPGGGVDVLRWRHADGGAGSPSAPALQRFEVAALPPIPPPPVLEPLAGCLIDIEERTGRAPELLRRIAAACDRSPATRDRWQALGLRLEPPDLDDLSEQDEEGVLEALGFSPFAEDDYHVYGFITGPAGPSGGRPLAVWRSDDLTLGWGGSDFDDWFSGWLANQRDSQSSLVSELLLDLGLAPDWASEPDYAPPPSWFTAAGGGSD
jgi:hypothetical protein